MALIMIPSQTPGILRVNREPCIQLIVPFIGSRPDIRANREIELAAEVEARGERSGGEIGLLTIAEVEACCCGRDQGITAAGNRSTEGQSRKIDTSSRL